MPPTLPIKPYRRYNWFVKILDSRGCWVKSSIAKLYLDDGNALASARWIGSKDENQYRGEFKIETKKEVSYAHLHICGLSFSSVSVNGNLLEEISLTSAPWTNNERSNGYSTVDITKYMGGKKIKLSVSLWDMAGEIEVYLRSRIQTIPDYSRIISKG